MNTNQSQDCRRCQEAMPDMLFETSPTTALSAGLEHMESCPACREEFAALQRTMQTLDAWQAPEPTPWFDGKLMARLREEEAARPEGLLERLRSYLLFSSGVQLRPVLVGGFALLLAISGGTALEVSHALHPAPVQASATVQDLQILDRNEQAIQTMDQLLTDDGNSDDSPAPAAPAS